MKRGRKPKGFNTHRIENEVDELQKQQNQELGTSLLDLPRPISFDILLKLSTKRLLICKCVCKPWRNLISDPEFAKLHFARAEAFPLIRSLSPTHISRNLYLVEPPEDNSGFDSGFCNCEGNMHSTCHCHFHMKLESKLKIPLRNAELLMNCEGDADVSINFKGGVKRKRSIKLRNKDHKLNVVNSCQGLLCLTDPSLNDPVVVCNPITGEFINLPAPTVANWSTRKFIDCGLGFSPKAEQYKVIRMFDPETRELMRDPITGREILSERVAEIHTLGTGSWRRIGCAPSSFYGYNLGFPSYLNGALHWLLIDQDISDYIISFDFEMERFESIPPPPLEHDMISMEILQSMSLGVLRGKLFIFDCYDYEYIDVWVMEKYGVQESWRKVLCIDRTTDEAQGRCLRSLYKPISYLRTGAILMFHRLSNAVVYYNPKDRFSSLKFLKVSGIKSKYEAIAHTPSLISLKDAVTGDNQAVLNITSRCAGFKLQGETKALFLKEEAQVMDSDFKLKSADTDENRE